LFTGKANSFALIAYSVPKVGLRQILLSRLRGLGGLLGANFGLEKRHQLIAWVRAGAKVASIGGVAKFDVNGFILGRNSQLIAHVNPIVCAPICWKIAKYYYIYFFYFYTFFTVCFGLLCNFALTYPNGIIRPSHLFPLFKVQCCGARGGVKIFSILLPARKMQQ